MWIRLARSLDRSQAEMHRAELQLRRQAGMAVEQYQAARITVEGYQTEILPRSQRLYEMQRKAWGRMALSYPQVLRCNKAYSPPKRSTFMH